MSKNVIFCYSGTGNCLDMAKNIARELGDTDIIMLRRPPVKTDVTDAERVGFIVPCHGGGLPGNVERYLDAIKTAPGSYKFAVGQFAGYLGTGLHTINKKFPLDYWRGVSHQCGCIWLFPHGLMLPPVPPKMAQKRSERIAREIAREILSRTVSKKAPPKMGACAVEHRAWPSVVKMKAKKLAASDACVGCGQCAKLCPVDNIKLVSGRPQFGRECIQCLSCLQYCPHDAITMGKVTERREHYHNPNVTPEELMSGIIHIN